MDLITGFLTELFSATGLSVSNAIQLGTLALVAVMILSVVLALGRRIDRLEERLMDLRQLHTSMQEAHSEQAHLLSSLASVAGAIPELDDFKQSLRGAASQQSELVRTLASISVEVESMRDVMTTSVPDLKRGLMALQESIEGYHSRIELMQQIVTTLQTEQSRLHKVLKAWNSQFKDLQQVVAVVPKIQSDQAAISKQLADWRSGFSEASEVLAEFLQPDPNGPAEH